MDNPELRKVIKHLELKIDKEINDIKAKLDIIKMEIETIQFDLWKETSCYHNPPPKQLW